MQIKSLLPSLSACAVASLPLQAATVNLDLSGNNSGSITLSDASNNFSYAGFNIDYLIVAGGGGGASARNSNARAGGGGGAGGLRQGTTAISGVQSVVVGAGGAGGFSSIQGGTGGNSLAFGITANGGGGGGNNTNSAGTNGGSGGGAGSSGTTFGTGMVGQGNDGASGGQAGTPTAQRGGGGGGAGGLGVAGNSGGAGGAGLSLSITGSSFTYAQGGNGGSTLAKATVTAAPATANTGNGGLGVAPNTADNTIGGGTGGTGIVVVRYTGSQVLTGGLVSTVGGDTVHQFTTTGASTMGFNATIVGDIDGSGGLNWNGRGELSLTGSNSYTGTTTINVGSTLSLAGLIASTSDLLFVSDGLLYLDSTGTINVLQSNYSITDANNDILAGFITGADNLQVSTFNDGSNLFTQITVIPEPSAAVLGSLGLLALLRRRR